MSRYKLVTIDPKFIAETVARTGSDELLDKATRSYVGIYDEETNWYIPLRANVSKHKPLIAYYLTPFNTNNPHFVRPGLDFQKEPSILGKIKEYQEKESIKAKDKPLKQAKHEKEQEL